MLKRLKQKFSTFLHLTFRMKILVIVAFWVVAAMRLILILLPFRCLTALMGKKHQESPHSLDHVAQLRAQKVGLAVNIVSNYTPWDSKCLVRALAAQLILKILRIPSTLYLGVSKDGSNNLIAHAWVRSGKHIITGAFEQDQFKCVNFFST